MLAPPQRHKRPRSPSPLGSEPDLDLASPLDILLKRQRREDKFWTTSNSGNGTFDETYHENQYQDHEQGGGGGGGGESSLNAIARRRSMAGVERRRTRQWEKQNAPQSQSQTEPDHYLSPSTSAQHRYQYPSPSPQHTRIDPMSSSPIRNHPPSSSPFRDKSSSQSHTQTQHHSHWLGIPDKEYYQAGYQHHVEAPESELPSETETGMDVEEMRREWGEEYAIQNSLLHSLHLARLGSQIHNQNQNQWNTHTPDSTQTTLISTPTLASATASPQQYTHTNTYRQPTSTYLDSSPLHSQSYEPRVHAYAHQDDQDDEMGIEVLDDWQGQGEGEREVDIEIKKRYEDANRLLAELDMARRRRWGE